MAIVSNALVVGGGIGGLTASVALRRQGIDVDLIEIQPRLSVYGVGIIQPNNVLRALDRIGLARQCVALGAPFPGWKIFDGGGALLLEAPGSSEAAPGLPPVNGITRPVLHKVLTDAALGAGVSIRTGTTVAALTDEGEIMHVRFSDGREARYDLVVGADGAHSSVRSMVFDDAAKPVFTGEGVWRYNFRRPASVTWGEVYYGADTKVGLVPMSPELMYMFVVTPEPGNPRMPPENLATLLRDRLRGYSGRVAELREQVTESKEVVYRPMESLLMPSPWFQGRTVLIGDAVHATTPHLAQGAAMAIEDAVLLAELLGHRTSLDEACSEFMARRFERAKFVVESSLQIGAWELEEWAGIDNPDARPGELLHSATLALLADY